MANTATVPVTEEVWRPALVAVAAFIALPISPLLLTMFSFQELVSRLLKVVL